MGKNRPPLTEKSAKVSKKEERNLGISKALSENLKLKTNSAVEAMNCRCTGSNELNEVVIEESITTSFNLSKVLSFSFTFVFSLLL